MLPLNGEATVKVTAVESMDLFYVHLEENHPRLVSDNETIRCILYYFYNSVAEVEVKLNQSDISPLVVPSITVGDVCSARFPLDNK